MRASARRPARPNGRRHHADVVAGETTSRRHSVHRCRDQAVRPVSRDARLRNRHRTAPAAVRIASFQMEHRGVPPQMMAQIVRRLPFAARPRSRRCPRRAGPASPSHVRHRVPPTDRRDRGLSRHGRRLPLDVVAALLMREAAAAENRVVAWQHVAPVALDTEDRGEHQVGPPSQKLTKCASRNASTSRGCSARICSQIPPRDRFALDPALQCRRHAHARAVSLAGEPRASAAAASATGTADCL